MGNRVASGFVMGLFLLSALGCAKAANNQAALEGPLSLAIQFTQAQSPDLLTESGVKELSAPPFDATQQAALVEQVNAVWSQCGISFETTAAPKELELNSLAELRAENESFDTSRRTVTQRIGRDSGTPNRQYQPWFDAYADAEAQGTHVARKIETRERTIPILVVPHVGSLFAGSTFGQTFGVADDDFMRSLFDGTFKVDSGARQWSKPLVIHFGYEMTYQYFMSKPQESFTCAENRGPGAYFNPLAHEVGHFLGLSHSLPKCNLMHNDSNLLTATQCATARKTAAGL